MDVSQKEIYVQNKFNELHNIFDKWTSKALVGMFASSILFLVKKNLGLPFSLFSFCMALYLSVGEGRRYADTRPGQVAEMFGIQYDKEFEEGLADIMEDAVQESAESLDDGYDFG